MTEDEVKNYLNCLNSIISKVPLKKKLEVIEEMNKLNLYFEKLQKEVSQSNGHKK